jgi:hypothetical protein
MRVVISGLVSVPGQNLPPAGVPGRTLAGCVLLSGSGPGLPVPAWAESARIDELP